MTHTAPCEGPDAFTHRAQAFTGSAGQRSREDIRRDEHTAAGVDHRQLRPKDVKFSQRAERLSLTSLQTVSADRRVARARAMRAPTVQQDHRALLIERISNMAITRGLMLKHNDTDDLHL